jgi:hypothetical protein
VMLRRPALRRCSPASVRISPGVMEGAQSKTV